MFEQESGSENAYLYTICLLIYVNFSDK